MPETITCPQCRSKLQLPNEVLGQQVQCPSCQRVFTADLPIPMAIPRDDPPRSSERSPPRERPFEALPVPRNLDQENPWEEPNRDLFSPETVDFWRCVRTGLHLHMIANFIYLAGLGLVLLLLLLRLVDHVPRGDFRALAVVIGLTASLVLYGNWLLSLVACCYWLLAPARFGARALAIACLVLVVMVLFRTSDALMALGQVRSFGGETEFLVTWLVTTMVFEVCRLTLLALFIRAVALNCGRSSLAGNALSLAMATPFLVGGLGLFTLMVSLIATSGPGSGWEAGLLAFVACVLFMGLLGWGGSLLQTARNQVPPATAPRTACR